MDQFVGWGISRTSHQAWVEFPTVAAEPEVLNSTTENNLHWRCMMGNQAPKLCISSGSQVLITFSSLVTEVTGIDHWIWQNVLGSAQNQHSERNHFRTLFLNMTIDVAVGVASVLIRITVLSLVYTFYLTSSSKYYHFLHKWYHMISHLNQLVHRAVSKHSCFVVVVVCFVF